MDPIIDPATGEPIEKQATDPPVQPQSGIDPKDFAELKGRLDAYEKMGFGHQRDLPPPPPTTPKYLDEVQTLETQVAAIDAEIDEAISNAQPVSALMRKRDVLNQKISRLVIKNEDIDPTLSLGIGTIDQLSDEVTRAKMPHLSHKSVKDTFESFLKELPRDQRMNPQVRMKVYAMSVGENLNTIVEAEREAALRSATQDPNFNPNGKTSRSSKKQASDVPKPSEVLGKAGLQAIRAKGISVDEEFKRQGYAGYADWFEKVGKTDYETNSGLEDFE